MPRARHSRSVFALASAVAIVVATLGCATTSTLAAGRRKVEVGLASYYGRAHDGQRTASGEPFDMSRMTAAHRSLPFGTRVRVKNLDNGREAVVRINDRGPFRRGRVIDVSLAAARKLGFVGRGIARVRVTIE
jgi:peptidoglycan lytic transglycosylase